MLGLRPIRELATRHRRCLSNPVCRHPVQPRDPRGCAAHGSRGGSKQRARRPRTGIPKDVAGYIRCAQVVVSVDTAIVHMAVGLETRLVAIYPDVDGQANPWLPPPSPLTRVVYSQQHPGQIRRTGKRT